ncbi:MAG: serine--tRNA ligase [bacterium]|nr:serine--tRNA ligase [bacterium]MBU1917198.1 serine--tRNA ligase [bacterium]
MLDIKWVLNNIDDVKDYITKRNADLPLDQILQFNDDRKKLQQEFDELRALQNQKSKEISLLKKEKKDAQFVIDEMQSVAVAVKEVGAKQSEIENQLKDILLTFPNVPHQSVPIGKSEADNQEVLQWGDKPFFSFKPKEHWELGENLGLLDFERAAKLAGSRFAIYRGALAKLERVLINFMLDVQTNEHHYEEVMTPFLVNADSLMGTGQLPKFEEDLFKTTMGYYLIPTAEVPVTNIYRGEMLKEEALPKKFCSFTPCFRSEAGSYGKDVKGLIRQHQFNKVELVTLCAVEKSDSELETLTQNAEKILQLLNLAYRKVVLCTGDMGFSAAKTYDLEVWLPGQNQYREISSCSNCTDFQARRMNTRYKSKEGKPQFVHTLNGSGLAVGRTLIAILENYQQEDGSIRIPPILQEAMGCSIITKIQ